MCLIDAKGAICSLVELAPPSRSVLARQVLCLFEPPLCCSFSQYRVVVASDEGAREESKFAVVKFEVLKNVLSCSTLSLDRHYVGRILSCGCLKDTAGRGAEHPRVLAVSRMAPCRLKL